MDLDGFREALERAGIVAFTLNDAARIIGKQSGYTRLFLSRLVKRGKILRIERGKYCLPGADEMEVASNLVYPSYISFLSALAFHRLTTQIPVQVQVACARQKRSLAFGNTSIVFVRLKSEALFGFRRFGTVFAAEPEKAVIDGLYVPGCLPLAEALYALRHGNLDIAMLCGYAERLGSSVVKRRLGFLLEKAGREGGAGLARGRVTRYALLNPLLRKAGKNDRRWRLIVNEVLA